MGGAWQTSFEKANLDFNALSSLVAEAERTSHDDINKLRSAYDTFLLAFPLCHGYWARYAYHLANMHHHDEAIIVYEKAINVASYSVDLWTSYCCFAMQFYEDVDDMRRLFERALSFVDKNYLCCLLWDKYIELELSNKELIKLAHIYLRTLRFPSRKLRQYYEKFKKLVILLEEETKLENSGNLSNMDKVDEMVECDVGIEDSFLDITHVIVNQPNDLLKPNMLKKYLLIGDNLYNKSLAQFERIASYEAAITRTYYHAYPLKEDQLENWHRYLDFVEKEGDLDWTSKLYERCLIPCANYQEFWIRYAEHMEANGGREIAKDVIHRALNVFLKGDTSFHHYSTRFMERSGDTDRARAFLSSNVIYLTENFILNIIRRANMEKRLGNIEEAYCVYEKAILKAEEQNLHLLPILYSHFARFQFVVTGSIDAAKNIFSMAIMKIPHCKELLEALIQFFIVHGGTSQVNVVDSMIAHALYPDADASHTLTLDDRSDISSLFIEFVDIYGTIDDIEKAWCRHRNLFPHLIRPALSNQCEKYPSLKNKDNKESGLPQCNERCSHDNGLKENDLAGQSGYIETDKKDKGNSELTKKKLGVAFSEDVVKRPNVATFGAITSNSSTAEEIIALDVINDTLEASKPSGEVRQRTPIGSMENFSPKVHVSDMDSIKAEIRKLDITESVVSEGVDKMLNSPEFSRFQEPSNLPSQTHARLEFGNGHSTTKLSSTHGQSVLSTRLHNDFRGTDSSVMSICRQVSSVQNSDEIRSDETQELLPQPQSGQADYQLPSQPGKIMSQGQTYQAADTVSLQNDQKWNCPVYAPDSQISHQLPSTVHNPRSEGYAYERNEQEFSSQQWYYYQQQMYYTQLQRNNSQLEVQHKKSETPLQLQQHSFHLLQNHQGSNKQLDPQLFVQQDGLQYPIQQNYLCQQDPHSSSQLPMAHHTQLCHQHHKPQVPEAQESPLHPHQPLYLPTLSQQGQLLQPQQQFHAHKQPLQLSPLAQAQSDPSTHQD